MNEIKSEKLNENLASTSATQMIDPMKDSPASSDEKSFYTPLVQDRAHAEQKFEDDSRELAFESLYTLQMYLTTLARISARIPDEKDEPTMKSDFNRLMEGIELLNETVLATREVLKARKSNDEQLLEADLFSILTDLLEANESQNILYRDQLLKEYLPQNLSEWKEKAIPALIRSADS